MLANLSRYTQHVKEAASSIRNLSKMPLTHMLHGGQTEPKHGYIVINFVAHPCKHRVHKHREVKKKKHRNKRFLAKQWRSMAAVTPTHDASQGMSRTVPPGSFCWYLSTPPHNCFSKCLEGLANTHMTDVAFDGCFP